MTKKINLEIELIEYNAYFNKNNILNEIRFYIEDKIYGDIGHLCFELSDFKLKINYCDKNVKQKIEQLIAEELMLCGII